MRIMRCALGLWAGLCWLGCGDDAGDPRDTPDAAEAVDASTKETVASVVADILEQSDRSLADNCPCYVEMGAYASVDECVMWQHSRDDWAPCVDSVLAKHADPDTLDAFRCMRELWANMLMCLREKPCDPVERAECGRSPLECLGGQGQLAVELATACPDVGLLSRIPQ
ncbi:MAG TPA: hypothetical protein VJR89_13020 [Polyangiales bacterium]|nr:hypothetical protein [Polyangiales bacterium]